jgi:hypothetical protein
LQRSSSSAAVWVELPQMVLLLLLLLLLQSLHTPLVR